eukprot:CAMPEP_0172471106 /NCGR_PEP_ID=MMETSP1065-20121228/67643_1 /TAXON_ID=265537 /ORGANISM="Amphiprora paludosa, Strain CCMP125" /LENGTH=173 /DNA_ID=CAMNT_0013229193 /DNA_START=86 /DNA_END=607 /DNA_ORIENTATION=-
MICNFLLILLLTLQFSGNGVYCFHVNKVPSQLGNSGLFPYPQQQSWSGQESGMGFPNCRKFAGTTFSSCDPSSTSLGISSGFSFSDEEQILVSVQKPLGILLEQDDDKVGAPIEVGQVLDPNGAAAVAGVQVGDILMAVQNADMSEKSLEEAMDFIANAPRVVNLRFLRMPPS